MKKIFIAIGSILIIAIIFIIGMSAFKKNNFSAEETAYYIVHSDMLKKSGGLGGEYYKSGIIKNPRYFKMRLRG